MFDGCGMMEWWLELNEDEFWEIKKSFYYVMEAIERCSSVTVKNILNFFQVLNNR